MIVKTSFFKNEIYLPHAKASITDSVKDVENKLEDFINIYERDALEKCLGRLSIEFFNEIDAQKTSLIKQGADPKWDWLMNGHSYTDSKGIEKEWLGIRRQNRPLGVAKTEPDYSFLAEYIFFYYESNANEIRTDVGNKKLKAANTTNSRFNRKAVLAWRRFVDAVQGNSDYKRTFFKGGFLGGYGVDYQGEDRSFNVSLYEFINDMNGLNKETYQNFNPKYWRRINEMTI